MSLNETELVEIKLYQGHTIYAMPVHVYRAHKFAYRNKHQMSTIFRFQTVVLVNDNVVIVP